MKLIGKQVLTFSLGCCDKHSITEQLLLQNLTVKIRGLISSHVSRNVVYMDEASEVQIKLL